MRPSDPRLRRLLRPAARPLAGVLAGGLVTCLLVVLQAWVVTDLVVAAVRGEDLRTAAWAVVAVLTVRGLVTWGGEVCSAAAAATVGTDLRRQLMTVAADPGTVGRSGELTVLVTRGVTAVEPYVTRYLPAVVLAGVLPPLTVIAIATQDLLSAVIVLATLPLVPVFGALIGLATRDRAREQWAAMGALSGHFVDVMKGLPTLVAHRRARAQSERIGEVTERYREASMRTLRIAFASSAVLELVATLSVALVAVTVGVRLAAGSLGLHTALVVLLLAPEAYWPLRRVGAEFHAAAEGVATFEAAHALLEAKHEPAAEDGGAAAPGADLVVDHLGVTYPGRATPALAPLDTTLSARGVAVVTGPSGCGKSTLLAALAGLVEPTHGRLLSGGRRVGGRLWQEQVAWLPQRPVFVEGSVADNLRLAAPLADADRLWEALRRVALEERVRALPRGIDTVLGEDGATLSAGERARLALARVVLAERPWVLLDEPTAHLDDLTERVIADTIVELGRESAVVVVAHRAAIVALADRTLELGRPAAPQGSAPPAPSEPRAAAPTPPRAPAEPVSRDPWPLWASTLVGALASASGVALTATAGWLIVQASTRPGVLTLLVAIVGVRTFGLARPVLRYVERVRSHDSALRMLARRRVQVYDAVVPLVPARLGRRRGDVLSSIVDDVDCEVDRELRVRAPVRSYVLVAALAAAVAALVLPAAAGAIGIGALVAGAGGWYLARFGARRAERDLVAARAELSTAVLDTAQVATELRMWQATDTATARIAAVADRLGSAGRRAATWLGAARALVLVTSGAAMAATAAVGAPGLRAGELSAPMLALLVLVPLALADVAAAVPDAGALSVRTAAAAARLDRLATTAPAVRDTVATGIPTSSDVALVSARARWEPHGPLTTPASLTVRHGERVALVGASGTGKSTVAALLLRFLDPAEGVVDVGGVSARSISLDDVRSRVGLVDDDPHVFATTVVENVRLARPHATDDEVEAALRRAHLGGWLDSLPEGLDAWIGEGHAGVSGGERARIGLARSLLADHPVLVLDEPTAHLDHPTALALAEEVLSGSRERAVLWITHAHVGLDLVDRLVTLGDVPAAVPDPGRLHPDPRRSQP
ncbi:thiol reductant ABC exporter subunit CydD [Nocardioides islandensis]|uniref:Thiol reductant ABC exporter subunit CydD n=1 Tax=Nocardioides islandensis TaxID=433663 RepID=A0A930VFT4_9ACTN|nr:thiol reductant ABC exporter subunit CydD [Nocardioides islandensis]MBF4765783.1 thiol reductant ABC exporter subunit CydD [Nocardioides islandensis]